MVENTLEIEDAVSQRYPAAKVQVVSFGSHSQMSIAEQVGGGGIWWIAYRDKEAKALTETLLGARGIGK